MKREIIDLNKQKTTETIYKNERDIINHATGEIISNETSKLVREKNREKFIKVFVDNLDYLIDNFTTMEKNVFLSLIKEMNYYNVIKLDSGLRKTIQVSADISQGTVSKAINSLIDKKALIKIEEKNKDDFKISFFTGKEYVVNPQLVGSGSFKELSKMRQIVVMDYDFDNFKSTKEITVETAYSGFDEISQNLDKYKLESIFQKKEGKNTYNEITISEKDDDIFDVEIDEEKSNNQNFITESISSKTNKEEKLKSRSDKELEYAIIIAQNEAKKLEIEDKKLDIELLKLKNNK